MPSGSASGRCRASDARRVDAWSVAGPTLRHHPCMEWLITLTHEAGRPRAAHSRPPAVRARVVIEDVRRLGGGAQRIARAVGADLPPLRDVQLLPSIGESWVLGGHEAHESDSGASALTWQTWVMAPAPDHDLERAELRIAELAREAAARDA